MLCATMGSVEGVMEKGFAGFVLVLAAAVFLTGCGFCLFRTTETKVLCIGSGAADKP